MKWIVKRDFFRVPACADIKITEACAGASVESPHANQIQKGGIFEMGDWKNEAEFQKPAKMTPEKKLLLQLRVAGCIGDASDTEITKRIQDEIAAEKKRLASETERIQKTGDQANAALLIEALTRLMQTAK